MEGQVYLCGWERIGHRYRLWLRSNPRVQAHEMALAAAERSLWRSVEERYGDGEPRFEFVPPLPRAGDEPCDSQAEWVTVSGAFEENAYSIDRNVPITTGRTCPACHTIRGDRTDVRLGVESFPPAKTNAIKLGLAGVARSAFSEEFLALLTTEERSAFEWRLVHPFRTSRRKFFELVSSTTVPPVAKAGAQFWTWQCPECEGMASQLWSPGYLNLPHFFSAADVARDVPAFAFGHRGEPELCLRANRWQEVAKQPAARGIISAPAIALPNELLAPPTVFPLPMFDRLSELQSIEWERLRDQWLESAEVLAMKADPEVTDDDVWEYVHAHVDELIALPRLYREHFKAGD